MTALHEYIRHSKPPGQPSAHPQYVRLRRDLEAYQEAISLEARKIKPWYRCASSCRNSRGEGLRQNALLTRRRVASACRPL